MNVLEQKNNIKVLISAEEIQAKVEEIADKLNKKYKDSEELTLICVLSGSVMFFTDLARCLKMPVKLEFIKVSSYEKSSTTGEIKEVLFNLPDFSGKDVVIVEDIVDTGITAKYLTERINNDFHPKTFCFVSLFDKKCTRKIDIEPDIYGFDIDDKFIVGYGLDYDGYYRNLPYTGYIE